MKLQDVETEIIKRQIKACKKLLTYYKMGGRDKKMCPLCYAASLAMYCRSGNCPWSWFTNYDGEDGRCPCVDYSDNHFGVEIGWVRYGGRRRRIKEARKIRIEQLKTKWIPEMKKELARRKK